MTAIFGREFIFPIFLSILFFGGLVAPSVADTNATSPESPTVSDRLGKIDAFLTAISPTYSILKLGGRTGRIVVDFCRNDQSCQDAIPILEVAEKSLVAAGKQPYFLDHAQYHYYQSYGKLPSPKAVSGLKKIQTVSKWASKWIGRIAIAVTVGFSAWEVYQHIRAGDYEEVTKAAIKTALRVVVIKLTGAFMMKCSAITLLVGTAVCVAAGVVVASLVMDKMDSVGDTLGGYIYAGGKWVAERQKNCVKKTDGFLENFCSIVPSPELLNAAQDVGSKLLETAVGIADKLIPSAADTPATASPRFSGIQVERNVSEGRTGAEDLKIHVRVDGSVVTVAPSGSEAVTRIGSTGIGLGSEGVGGAYTTRIDGSVVNRGGQIEINPIGGCAIKRNGQCCIEIHRNRCVVEKYKRKNRIRACAEGFELGRNRRYCYRYADHRHSITR